MLYVHSPRNQVCLCGSVSNYLDRFSSSLNTEWKVCHVLRTGPFVTSQVMSSECGMCVDFLQSL